MIIEFVGLPGAGKSTLERLVLARLESEGAIVTSRQMITEAFVRSTTALSRDGNAILRRISTAGYKAMLLRAALGSHTRLRLREFPHAHLRNVATRCAESHLLAAYAAHHAEVVNLSDGRFQHRLSVAVWRAMAGFDDRIAPPPYDANSLIVNLDISADQAFERLQARGRPEAWPVEYDTREVLERYIQHKRTLDAQVEDAAYVMSVDATGEKADWAPIAATVVARINRRVDDKPSGAEVRGSPVG